MKWTFVLFASVSLLCSVNAEEACPVEAKILLSPPIAQPVASSFGFGRKSASVVYFFDTDSLDLLTRGVIVRIRQGASNDLTVKLRPPDGSPDKRFQLRGQFPCEIDLTRSAATASYAVGRQYKAAKVPEFGTEIYSLFSDSQKRLLNEARVSIDWSRVVKIASINSTTWQTAAQSAYGKLSLELWEWPAGKILELSAKAPPAADVSKYSELEQLLKIKGFSLSANQDTKTTIVLQTLLGENPSRR